MRAFGRDLIRGGHYGQRSCEPHLKAEHMAAPTNAANVKKALANSEPSTHGTFLPCQPRRAMSVIGGRPADICSMRVLRSLTHFDLSTSNFCCDAQLASRRGATFSSST